MSRAEFAWSRAVTVGAGVALAVLSLHGQNAKPAAQVEWKTYGSDLASTRYSPLDQINKDQLHQAADRLAAQDRLLRSAPRHALFGDAA